MTATDEIQRVAAVLERPRAGYMKRVASAQRAVVTSPGEASRQLAVFADRIADLTLDELRELYEETFRGEQPEIEPLVQRLVGEPTGAREAEAALHALAPLLDRLEQQRNPHACAMRSLCCLLSRRLEGVG
jgi:nitrate reductase assembly molybdenum cofactor insertion protein NarJ